jgi:outer membrane protein OmpA-like peptidoglycan-associated protein
MAVELQGHTDNVGGSAANLALSERRAQRVGTWLQEKSPDLFPRGRITLGAYGDTRPVAPNATAEGRARNRRVTVVLGVK